MGSIPGKAGENRKPAAKETDGFRGIGPLADGPACLAAGGLKPGSPIYRFFGAVSRKLYNRADRILITSHMFHDYLVNEHGVDSSKIEYFPQYAPSRFEHLPPVPEKDKVDFVFAGNIGAAQSLDTVLQAAKRLQGDRKSTRLNSSHPTTSRMPSSA